MNNREKEFVIWLYLKCHQFILRWPDEKIFYNIEDQSKWTFNQVYEYWQKEIYRY